MANKVITKNRIEDDTVPTTTQATLGELALNAFTGKLYAGTNLAGTQINPGETSGQVSWIGAPIDNNDSLGTSDVKLSTQGNIKKYVDDSIVASENGLDWKKSVRVATTANITLSNVQTIDGVSAVHFDRVLVKDQSDANENGIYECRASGNNGSWVRTADAGADADFTGGLAVFVEEGTTNADSAWVCTNNGTVDISEDDIAFTQFSGLGQITAGDGMAKSGNTLSVGAGTGITVNNDDIETNDSEISHDALSGFVANEHLDWTSSVGTIHSGNYTNTGDTTYTAGNGLLLTGTAFTLDDPGSQGNTMVTENDIGSADIMPIWDDSASEWKYVTIENLQDEIDTDNNDNTNQLTTFNIQDDDADAKTIAQDSYVKFVIATGTAGSNWSGSGTSNDPWIMTMTSPNTNTTYTSGDFTHDSLAGVDSSEHIDWTADQGNTNIHSGNYTNTNTTYSVMANANSYAAGLVPAGHGTHSDTYLRKDGTWVKPIDTNTDTTYSAATSSALGLMKLEDDTEQSVAANTVTATAGRTYGVQFNSSDQAVVNVPWVDTVTVQLSQAQVEDYASNMFTGNTETGITTTYQASDNTLDLVVTTQFDGSQNTSGSAGSLSATLAVSSGGTGVTSFTDNGILYGDGSNALDVTAAGTDGYFLYSNSGTPSWTNTFDGGTF